MDVCLGILIDGLIHGSRLFLAAVGFTLTFGVLKIVNVAHGSFFALGAYFAATVVTGVLPEAYRGGALSLVAIAGAALAAAVLLGPLVERGVFQWFYKGNELNTLLVTYAIFMILEDLIKLVWGATPLYVTEPYEIFGTVHVFGLGYVGYDFFMVALAVGVGLAVWFALNRTNAGKITLAVIHNAEISRCMGVKVGAVFAAAFTVSLFLAFLGGAFTAPMISVGAGLGADVILLSFAVVIIGGLGSIEGAAIGALLVGIATAAAVNVAPQLQLFCVYAVMTLVLIVRPSGLMAAASARQI